MANKKLSWSEFRKICKEQEEALHMLFATWEKIEDLKQKQNDRAKRYRNKQKEEKNVQHVSKIKNK